jgi:hypothetical protein
VAGWGPHGSEQNGSPVEGLGSGDSVRGIWAQLGFGALGSGHFLFFFFNSTIFCYRYTRGEYVNGGGGDARRGVNNGSDDVSKGNGEGEAGGGRVAGEGRVER